MAEYWYVIMAAFIVSATLIAAVRVRWAIRARRKSSKGEGKRYLEKEFILYFLETLNLAEGERHMIGRR